MTNKTIEKTDNEYDVIEDLHKGREQLLNKFDGNLRALFDDAKSRDAASSVELVNREKPHASSDDQTQAS